MTTPGRITPGRICIGGTAEICKTHKWWETGDLEGRRCTEAIQVWLSEGLRARICEGAPKRVARFTQRLARDVSREAADPDAAEH